MSCIETSGLFHCCPALRVVMDAQYVQCHHCDLAIFYTPSLCSGVKGHAKFRAMVLSVVRPAACPHKEPGLLFSQADTQAGAQVNPFILEDWD